MAARRQPARPGGGPPPQADAGGHADPGLPRPRSPHRRPRPAGLERAGHAGRARPGDLRADDLGPRPRVPHRRRGGQGSHAPRRPARRAPRRVLPLDRHRVHAHPGHGRAALDPVQGRGDQGPAELGRAAPPPRAAERGRGARALPGHEVRRHQALRARGGGVGDPHPRQGAVGGGRQRARRLGHRHGPPRPAQRAGQHRGQELRPDLPGVRGLRRPDVGPGLRRREVPPRRGGQVRQPVGRGHQGRAGGQPEPPGDRRSDRARDGAGQAGPDRPARAPTPGSRSSSTATPRSRARGSWPSAWPCPTSSATGSAARST